ncbi:MAG: molybdopterin molybdotransferase MoeA [Planctomycetes bacterium]|nr:molybdopterin molybdotransferase MoeA [Planctomycetota bacterium]
MNPFGSLVSADDAQDLILAKLKPITDTITVDLKEASGYALAEDIKSSMDVPAFDRAAMDGYAVIAADLHEPAMLKIVGAAFAGKPFKGSLKRGECIEIATGAAIPKGCDAVVMVETVQVVGQAVQCKQAARAGDNITRRGEDITRGEVVVKKGTLLGPGQVAAIAICGRPRVKVFRKPEVLIFTTGDEVVAPGKALKNGQVYDCNSFAMMAIAKRAGASVTYKANVQDTQAALMKVISQSVKKFDLIVFSGGTSVGNKDFGYEVVSSLGDVYVRGVAIKPGKPVLFGTVGKCGVFGMPGYPTSCLLTAELFLAPAVRRLAHTDDHHKARRQAKLGHEIKQDKTKQQLVPVRIDENDLAWSTFKGSGNITSLSQSVGFISIDAGDGVIAKGVELIVNVIK